MQIVYRQHAIRRMFERHLSEVDVEMALADSRVIESYPDDKPYPSCLCLGYINGRPLHVVVADNIKQNERIIITVYEPDPLQWYPDFTTRK